MPLNHLSNPNSLYKYYLDSHYKSDSLEKCRKFKEFFNVLCQNIFDINLTMLEGVEEFPLVCGENKSYSSIAAAINNITPYHINEYGIYYNDGLVDKEKNKNKKWRKVDFWCCSKDKSFDVWIEVKYIEFYFDKNNGWKIYSNHKERVKNVYEQILGIRGVRRVPRKDKIQSHKLALLNTLMCCPTEKYYEKYCKDKKLEQAPKDLAKVLCDEIGYDEIDKGVSNHLCTGLLLGVLDLRECIKNKKDVLHRYKKYYEKDDCNKYVAPYIILAGIVLE